MRDPLTHAPKDVIFTHGVIRDVIVQATGMAPDLPKTVTTACGRRRPLVATSPRPDAVTCLACRDDAAAQHEQHAELAAAALNIGPVDPATRKLLVDNEDVHRKLAAAFRALP